MRKFLGTYLFAIATFIVILVIFDYAEKVDDFIANKAPMSAIVFQYYLNFVPSFINQFSGLFTFIAVIFVTSKMAYNTEIIAMLSGGMSFRRLMWPYFLSALSITLLALVLNLWVIPRASDRVIAFESTYISKARSESKKYDTDIYRQIGSGTFVYLRSFVGETSKASYFAIEKYEGTRLVEALEAADASYYDDLGRWRAPKYTIRRMYDGNEEFSQFQQLDTLINLNTSELGNVDKLIKTMNISELNEFVDEQGRKGSDMMSVLEVERQSRFSYPAAILILTLIGVSLSSRKVRGGTGLHIGLGIALCFGYILFSRFAEEFAKGGVLPAAIAVWIPNLLFLGVAIWLYVKAPK
jgi:lipopolysaccharide export system permease protein